MRGERHHHGGNVCGLLCWGLRYFSYYSYSRKPTGREFFVPARTLIVVFLLKTCQNLVLVKNNQVLLTIGQILGTAAEKTGWLTCSPGAITRVTSLLHRQSKIDKAKALLLCSNPRPLLPPIFFCGFNNVVPKSSTVSLLQTHVSKYYLRLN
jgi:hypothetical protein